MSYPPWIDCSLRLLFLCGIFVAIQQPIIDSILSACAQALSLMIKEVPALARICAEWTLPPAAARTTVALVAFSVITDTVVVAIAVRFVSHGEKIRAAVAASLILLRISALLGASSVDTNLPVSWRDPQVLTLIPAKYVSFNSAYITAHQACVAWMACSAFESTLAAAIIVASGAFLALLDPKLALPLCTATAVVTLLHVSLLLHNTTKDVETDIYCSKRANEPFAARKATTLHANPKDLRCEENFRACLKHYSNVHQRQEHQQARHKAIAANNP
jgi:hypothetical protein